MEQALLGMYTRENAALAHGPIGSREAGIAFRWTWAVAREKHEEAPAMIRYRIQMPNIKGECLRRSRFAA